MGGIMVWSFLPVESKPTATGVIHQRGDNPPGSKLVSRPPADPNQDKQISPSANSRLTQLLEEYSEISSTDSSAVNTRLVATLQRVLEDNDESRRTLHFSLMLEAMRVQDAPAVAEMFQQLKRQGLEFHAEANFFAQRWGELDANTALAYIVDGGSFERDGILLDRVLSGWASKLPAEASQWVLEQPDGPLKDSAISGTATGLARNDPTGATQFFLGLPDGESKNRAAQTVFWQVLYKSGMDAAAVWYDSLPVDQKMIRQQVFQLISARQLLTQKPEAENWVHQRQSAFTD